MKKILLLVILTCGYIYYCNGQDIVVAQDGSGDYATVQQAFNAVPSNSSARTVIYIKNGTYKEVLTLASDKINVTIIGESVDGVILTYDNYASKINPATGTEYGTSGSSSTYIRGSGFYAWNITFQNSSGPVGQALAVYISGDKAVFRNCKFLGWQDTMYGGYSRQYFTNCYIEGSTDFIFGPSTAFFESCQIYSKGGTALTAASTESYIEYGYVFNNCTVTGASGVSTYLGRTWRPYAATTFMNSSLSSIIRSEGWSDWGDASNQLTARYNEYNNSGAGADLSGRVSWSNVLSSSQAAYYTATNILKTTYTNPVTTDNWSPFDVINNTSPISGGVYNGTINGTYAILASHSGKALDVYNWGTVNGTNICQWTYWGGETQQFNIAPVDGEWHRITPVLATDKGLDVNGVSTSSGANIQIWDYWGGYGQQFRFQSAGTGVWRIIARHSDKCFDVEGASTADGANVQQWNCTSGSAWQMFQLVNLKSADEELIEPLSDEISIYPNPAHEYLNLNIQKIGEDNTRIIIYNNLGQKVSEFNTLHVGVNTLNINDLCPGLYVVRFFCDKEQYTRNFAKR